MPEQEAVIFNIQRFSTEDGPGIRTTVFFKGCPMRCPWCHNPESLYYHPEVVWHGGRCLNDRGCVEICPERALRAVKMGTVPSERPHSDAAGDGTVPIFTIRVDRERCNGCGRCVEFCPSSALEMHGRKVPVGTLFNQVIRDAPFYGSSGGGVTLSGGEPLAQPHATIALMRLLDEAGVHTALDTCGAVSEWALRETLDLLDLVLLDIKTVDPAKHLEFTGIEFEVVAASVRLINESGVPVWVRTPIIPGYTDDDATVRAVARFVAETLQHCERHDLLAFSNLCTSKYEQLDRTFPLARTPLLDIETMDRLVVLAREEGSPGVHWSGPTRVEKGNSESRIQNPE